MWGSCQYSFWKAPIAYFTYTWHSQPPCKELDQINHFVISPHPTPSSYPLSLLAAAGGVLFWEVMHPALANTPILASTTARGGSAPFLASETLAGILGSLLLFLTRGTNVSPSTTFSSSLPGKRQDVCSCKNYCATWYKKCRRKAKRLWEAGSELVPAATHS